MKIKYLSVLGAAGLILLSTATFATEKQQKYEVPAYTLENAEKKVSYQGGDQPITIESWGIDRNGDRKIDLIYVILDISELKGSEGNLILLVDPAHKQAKLYIDDDYNGNIDRELSDWKNEKGELGMDGIYDCQDRWAIGNSIEDFFRSFL